MWQRLLKSSVLVTILRNIRSMRLKWLKWDPVNSDDQPELGTTDPQDQVHTYLHISWLSSSELCLNLYADLSHYSSMPFLCFQLCSIICIYSVYEMFVPFLASLIFKCCLFCYGKSFFYSLLK